MVVVFELQRIQLGSACTVHQRKLCLPKAIQCVETAHAKGTMEVMADDGSGYDASNPSVLSLCG
jgi:hypothetical protein